VLILQAASNPSKTSLPKYTNVGPHKERSYCGPNGSTLDEHRHDRAYAAKASQHNERGRARTPEPRRRGKGPRRVTVEPAQSKTHASHDKNRVRAIRRTQRRATGIGSID